MEPRYTSFHQATRERTRARGLAYILLLGAALLLCSIGCGKKNEQAEGQSKSVQVASDCNAVGAKLAEFTQVQSQGLEGRKAKIMGAHLQMVKEDAIKTCKDENWSIDIRSCMTVATDIDGFNACTAPLRKAKGLPPPSSTSHGGGPASPIPPGVLEKAGDVTPER